MAKKYRLSGIQKWMDSQKGQTFLNFAYSWGASVVIAGALFKLTHIAGADIMLFLGMGTEVIVFFLAGFEHQSAIGVDIDNVAEEERNAIDTDEPNNMMPGVSGYGGGTVIIGGGSPIGGGYVGGGSSVPAEPTPVTLVNSAEQTPTPVTIVNAAELADNISNAPAFSAPQCGGMTPEMQDATNAYVEQLTNLTEVLKQVAEQSMRLTRDSEEMETMNRTLTGINRFYEMQLRSVGTQSATIDDVNEQTRILASKLQELNEVYTKMVDALKLKIS